MNLIYTVMKSEESVTAQVLHRLHHTGGEGT